MTTTCPKCHHALRIYTQGDKTIAECINGDCPRCHITRELEELIGLSAAIVEQFHVAAARSKAVSDAAEADLRAADDARRQRWLAKGKSIEEYERLFNTSHLG